jgi:hypothetical protein
MMEGISSLSSGFEITGCEADRCALGFAGIAKQLSIDRIEAMRGREEPVAVRVRVPHDNSRRLRADFDDVGVRHVRFEPLIPQWGA